jgi:hypothetical protein
MQDLSPFLYSAVTFEYVSHSGKIPTAISYVSTGQVA